MNKVKLFFKQNNRDILSTENNLIIDELTKWSEQNKGWKKLSEILNDKNLLPNINDFLNELKGKEKERQDENQIQSDLWALLKDNEDKHIGTKKLIIFYKAYNIDYANNFKQRMNHYNRISKIRKILRQAEPFDSDIISGPIMKELLNLTPWDRDPIDGWCFTRNKNWILQYAKHEKHKHGAIEKSYNKLESKLE